MHEVRVDEQELRSDNIAECRSNYGHCVEDACQMKRKWSDFLIENSQISGAAARHNSCVSPHLPTVNRFARLFLASWE